MSQAPKSVALYEEKFLGTPVEKKIPVLVQCYKIRKRNIVRIMCAYIL